MQVKIKKIVIGLVWAGLAGLILLGLGKALTPLLVAFGLAYLVFPLIMKLEHKGIKRSIAVLFVLLLIAASITGLLIAIVPDLVSDARAFFAELPTYSARALEKVERIATRFGYQLDIGKRGLKDFVRGHMTSVSTAALNSIAGFVKQAFSNLTSVLMFIVSIFLVPVFFFHVIDDYENISKEFKSLVPRSVRPWAVRYAEIANRVLSGYVRGQLMVVLILGLLYGIGLSIIGLQFGFLIGFCTGLLSIIPFVGPIIGFIFSCIIALANHSSGGTLLGIITVFAFVQGLEGMVITPRLVGNKVGLSTLATMLAVIVGGNLLGFIGIVLAIPSAAILKYVIEDLKQQSSAS